MDYERRNRVIGERDVDVVRSEEDEEREVVSGAWNSFARNSQSGAIYTLRAGLSRWGAWQWAAHAPVSQAALNYRSCGIDDAILP